jgi:uncharacterized protein
MMADYQQGQISRRQLLRGLGFAGLGTAALSADLATAVPAPPVASVQSKDVTSRRAAGADPDPDNAEQAPKWIEANYTKNEYQIPMRDGVRLFTAVYIPKDASLLRINYPIVLTRTPFSVQPYGVDNYPAALGLSNALARSKYIFVNQDVRGCYMSEGTFLDVRPYNPNKKGTETDEASDAYDTIDWLIKNIPYTDGKVGVWGDSYPGFYAVEAMLDAHPALKAVCPQAPVADWFLGDDFHHHGALLLAHLFSFISSFGLPRPEPATHSARPDFEYGTPDGYAFYKGIEPLPLANEKYLKHRVAFWDDCMEHPNYDSFWQARSVPQYVRDIRPAVLLVGGWFDAEDLTGTLNVYKAAAKNNPRGPIRLVIGPWSHGGWSSTEGERLGDVDFASKTSDFYHHNVEFPFFEYYLKGRGEMTLPPVYAFETGTNQWQKYDSWPPKGLTRTSFYLGPRGTVSAQPPTDSKKSFDEYVSDPAKPVPYTDNPTVTIEQGYDHEFVDADQRLQGRRTDVLVYQSEILKADMSVAGPVEVSLQVSTTGTDADWVVKLIDVYPPDMPDELGDYQQLVRGDVMRGRFRNSYAKPEPFTPGKMTKVQFVMDDINHTFQQSHRVMIQVQSSWFPLVDLNPQKFVDINTAKPSDFQQARMRVYHSPEPSNVDVLVLAGR